MPKRLHGQCSGGGTRPTQSLVRSRLGYLKRVLASKLLDLAGCQKREKPQSPHKTRLAAFCT
eukprot:4734916-Amphidinium_carterae.2